MDCDAFLTLSIAGNHGVGKTQIINRYTVDTFCDSYNPTGYCGMFI